MDESGDKDKMDMFADALPKQQRMLMQSGLLILPFFRQKQSPLLQPKEQSSLNYFASAWCALENMLLAATAEGLGTVFHIPVADEVVKIKEIVGAPEDYEFTVCLRWVIPQKMPSCLDKKNRHRGADTYEPLVTRQHERTYSDIVGKYPVRCRYAGFPMPALPVVGL